MKKLLKATMTCCCLCVVQDAFAEELNEPVATELDSFWFGDKSGASRGYLAGGEPDCAAKVAFMGTIAPPKPHQAVTNRAHTGIPSIAIAPNGRLWATWYTGCTPEEDHNNYVVLSTSGDAGRTWSEVLVADPDGSGPWRAFDPELWISPDGILRWVFTYRNGGKVETSQLWVVAIGNPCEESSKVENVVYAGSGVMMGKPIVLSSGEWALPVCDWFAKKSSKVVVSSDGGKTYSVRGAAGMPKVHRLFDEQQLVERRDGSLWMMARTKMGIAEAFSFDLGKTWTEYAPSWLQHPSSRFLLRRLRSGNILLVKHGPAVCPKTGASWRPIGRCNLMAMLSRDDGRTWEGGLMLDERSGVSYPDGEDDADGLIHVVYDYDRRGAGQILMATFREEDVLSGNAKSPTVKLRRQVSRSSGGIRKAANKN